MRRAEALWDTLRAGAPLPPAHTAAAFHGRLFDDHALALRLPHPASAPGARACVLRIGQALAQLGLARPDLAHPHRPGSDLVGTGPIGARLADMFARLAERACSRGEPALLEMDTGLDPGDDPEGAAILLRAVALPFAPADATRPDTAGCREPPSWEGRRGDEAPGHERAEEEGPGHEGAEEEEPGQRVVIIASWRHLLPPGEAAALYRELEAAIGRLREVC